MAYLTNPRHIVIRWLTPLIWRLFPARQLSALQSFSLIEKDSACQLLYCLSVSKDETLKAYLFQHVLEEFYHAEIFEQLCREQSTSHFYQEFLPRQQLIEPGADNGKILDFFAYVHEGERAVNRDFLAYSEAHFEPRIRQTFRRAGLDEAHHERDTDEIISKALGGTSAHRWSRLKASAKRSWELFKSGSKAFGIVPMTIILSAVYIVIGGLVASAARKRLLLESTDQLKLFKDQARAFEEGRT
jgi:hypothetical protein